MKAQASMPDTTCRRCRKPFACHAHEISSCRCNTVTLDADTLQFLEKTSWGCLCASCLRDVNETIVSLKGETFPEPNNFKEGVHYYIENGYWVFTEHYHILRGHCCKSGCRHCAYGFEKASDM